MINQGPGPRTGKGSAFRLGMGLFQLAQDRIDTFQIGRLPTSREIVSYRPIELMDIRMEFRFAGTALNRGKYLNADARECGQRDHHDE